MRPALKTNIEIREVPKEALDAWPRPAFRPVAAWAWAGALILGLQLYVWGLWITGPNFVRVPPGPSDPPTFMKVILSVWTGVICLGLPVAIYYVVIKPWRRERRITTDAMLMGAFGLVFFQDPLLNYFNTWSTYNTWMWNRGSWVLDVPGWMSFGQPGAMMAEPLLMNAPGYTWGVLICTMLGCWVMRRAKLRWPSIGVPGLLGVLVVWTFFFDLVIEGLFLMPMGLFTYPGAIQWLSINAGTYYQWPIYEGIMWGGVQAGFCSLRYFTDDRGRTFVERGLERIQGGAVKRESTRFLAIFAAVSMFFFVFTPTPGPKTSRSARTSRWASAAKAPGGSARIRIFPSTGETPPSSGPRARWSFRKGWSSRRSFPSSGRTDVRVEAYKPARAAAAAPYYRALGDEVEVFRAAARRGLPVLLKGPTGCGKTRFVEAMAHELGRNLITVAGHEDLTSADLVGRFLLKGGETTWVDGPLTRAVREGAICYLDEVVEARQDTTVVIHPLADHRRELPIDRLGISLEAAPGFQLVISYNPGYQSVLKNIKESTRQRFVAIPLDFHPIDVETEVVAHEAGIDLETARALVKIGDAIRRLDGAPLQEVASTRLLVSAGGLVAEGLGLRRAVQSAIVEALSDDPDVVRALGELVDAVVPGP
jgi:MoxR-like ATPase